MFTSKKKTKPRSRMTSRILIARQSLPRQLLLFLMLHGTIRNGDFLRNKALNVGTMLQPLETMSQQ